jgi:hypothetical protein
MKWICSNKNHDTIFFVSPGIVSSKAGMSQTLADWLIDWQFLGDSFLTDFVFCNQPNSKRLNQIPFAPISLCFESHLLPSVRTSSPRLKRDSLVRKGRHCFNIVLALPQSAAGNSLKASPTLQVLVVPWTFPSACYYSNLSKNPSVLTRE